jgi:predicted HTH domain antitoxin
MLVFGQLKEVEAAKVHLQADLLQAANLDFSNLSPEAAYLLALELFHEKKISHGRAAEL